jgi:uncharacterized DUF497 family protein
MEFEYDPQKSVSNKEKHKLDFDEGQQLWKDPRGLVIAVVSEGSEDRYVLIARLLDRHWTAVFTIRDGRIRIISIRRARLKEIALYENR